MQKQRISLSLLALTIGILGVPSAHAQGDFQGRFSPDGKKILFYSYRHQDASYVDAKNAEVYMMDADGSYQVRLTYTDHEAYSLMPLWSPDGKQIAFASGPDMRTLNAYVMNLDGRDRKVIAPGVIQSWSADGAYINLGSKVLHLEAGEESEIEDENGEVLSGIFSPDWSKIAYSKQEGDFLNLYIYDRATKTRQQITEQVNAVSPEWSFDSQKVVFAAYLGGGWETSEIFVVNADGTDLKQVTHDGGNAWKPAWSPDGSRILFSSDKDNKQYPYLYVMNENGSHVTQLTGH